MVRTRLTISEVAQLEQARRACVVPFGDDRRYAVNFKSETYFRTNGSYALSTWRMAPLVQSGATLSSDCPLDELL